MRAASDRNKRANYLKTGDNLEPSITIFRTMETKKEKVNETPRAFPSSASTYSLLNLSLKTTNQARENRMASEKNCSYMCMH